ncbi:PTS system IIC component [Salmonella enterica subsp. enterica serovar Daytona]|uniref:PTS system IIC component n=1 Tax=Salmonella enterica subsp. enterica serovar Daytona TaxID=1962639 RepID=A0A447JET7_SALET|nr:PTS system IIC component [Salmonella enterica subsp. enterica serovar Daytona]
MAIKKRSATVVPGASGAAAAVKKPQASGNSFWGELPQHVMSGISRMVPTLIMGGVILAFSQLIAYSWAGHSRRYRHHGRVEQRKIRWF